MVLYGLHFEFESKIDKFVFMDNFPRYPPANITEFVRDIQKFARTKPKEVDFHGNISLVAY